MNAVLQTLHEHRTYRQFDPAHRIPAEQVQAMLDATRQAPSWMNGQHYTIIRITDPALRQKIAAAQPSNPQIGTCGEYWIFVADARRAMLCSQAAGGSFAAAGTPEMLITLVTDAALAAQNAVVAAESLGLGTLFHRRHPPDRARADRMAGVAGIHLSPVRVVHRQAGGGDAGETSPSAAGSCCREPLSVG